MDDPVGYRIVPPVATLNIHPVHERSEWDANEMKNNHRYCLSIPLNIDDLEHIEEGVLWEDIKFEEYQMSKLDYDNLFDLFCQFDKPFDIIIDEYEEEIIPASGIQTAIEMTESFAAKAPPAVKTSSEKFLVALKRAKELGKQILLSF